MAIASEFDFENDDHCPPDLQVVFTFNRSVGTTGMLECVRNAGPLYATDLWGLDENSLGQSFIEPLMTLLGEFIFARLPEKYRTNPLPDYYFHVNPVDKTLRIEFAFLPSVIEDTSRIYYSPEEPKVPFGGGQWKMGFFKHALERACQRIATQTPISYRDFSLCVKYLRHCTHFESLTLPDGQEAVRLYMPVSFPTGRVYMDEILADGGEGSAEGEPHYVLGYCPLKIIRTRAVALTFLYPGYSNTPEHELVRNASISPSLRQELLQAARDNTAEFVLGGQTTKVIKWYHDNGVPQVVRLKQSVLQAPLIEGTAWPEEKYTTKTPKSPS